MRYIPKLSSFLLLGSLVGQSVGIGTASPHTSARLHVHQGTGPTYYGLLIPQVPLLNSTDAATIPSPAHSLLVYVPAGSGLTPAGYYYNSGSETSPVWVRLLHPGDAWLLLGNAGTNPAINFLGTTDNQPLVIRVNNQQTFRFNLNYSLQRDAGGNARGQHAVDLQSSRSNAAQVASGDYSVVGGGRRNSATGTGATVAGGQENTASGISFNLGHAAVGGGAGNTASGDFSVIGGGYLNQATGFQATLSGGRENQAQGESSTVSGGTYNVASGGTSTIGGGQQNVANHSHATIAGGRENTITNEGWFGYGTIGGGIKNTARGDRTTVSGGGDNVAYGIAATVGGGDGNQSNNSWSTISGGQKNRADGLFSTIGGGAENLVQGRGATIGGGEGDTATAPGATIGGGLKNKALHNSATVAGGIENVATGVIFGASTVGGGRLNTASGDYSTVSGGARNAALNNHTTVSGGVQDTASGPNSTVGGGYLNVASANATTIAGGQENRATGSASTIAGGYLNFASGFRASIGGGERDTASGGSSTVGGGTLNRAVEDFTTVSGGYDNIASGHGAAIGGGAYNTASGAYSAIPGGYRLRIGSRSFGFSGQTSATQTDLSANSNIAAFVDVDLWVYNVRNQAGLLRLYEPSGSGTNYTAFRAQAQTADITYTLPAASPSTPAAWMQSDPAGNMTWRPVLYGAINIDPPSISANASSVITITLTGVSVGDHLLIMPPSDIEGELLFQGASVTAANTVQVRLYNLAGSPVDGTSKTWNYLVIRP